MAPPKSTNKEIVTPSGSVTSIAERCTPPDTLALTMALQTTLDLDEQLRIFDREASQHVAYDSVQLSSERHQVERRIGDPARHRANYNLVLGTERLGELTFTGSKRFAEQDLMRLEHLLSALVYPLRNALHCRALELAAYKDPLTGVGNRAALEDALHREIELARRKGRPLTLLSADLDHFKRINDEYGHSTGDAVLQAAAGRIRSATRGSDLLFRYGGEEFVALLADTDATSATIVAERIRRAMADRPVAYEGREMNVTVSLGVATHEPPDDAKRLFDKADVALYTAKRGGRNRVEVFGG